MSDSDSESDRRGGRTVPGLQPRPIFFLFLWFGVFIFLPLLLLMPLAVMVRAAWYKSPSAGWRTAILFSFIASLVVASPLSPWYHGLQRPVTPNMLFAAFGANFWLLPILEWQRPGINMALLTNLVFFPLSLAAAMHTRRRRMR